MGRRLTDIEILTAAANPNPPEFTAGQRVRIFYSVQDPADATVVTGTDEHGWIKVREDGGAEFEALASCAVALEDYDG